MSGLGRWGEIGRRDDADEPLVAIDDRQAATASDRPVTAKTVDA